MNDEVVNSCTLRNSQGGNACKLHCPFVILLSLECFIFVLFLNIYFIINFFYLGGGKGG